MAKDSRFTGSAVWRAIRNSSWMTKGSLLFGLALILAAAAASILR